ncbi:MAG: hypothetical protein HOP11_07645 [Saprospiraceae bacterium]|nr:hypothetical protein [Saprospiraceae bacterium]
MDAITKYFTAERNESILFLLAGLLAVVCSIYFLIKLNKDFYSGLSYSLVSIAIIQWIVGASIYIRSPKDIERVQDYCKHDKTQIQLVELPRMEKVMKSFQLYKFIEISLLLIGLFLFFYFPSESLWKGFGLGLLIQSALMLILDFFAERRGKEYINYLLSL